MSGVTRDRSVFLGLAALQDIADDARVGPIAPSLQLRGLLALMALQASGDLQTYKDFWEACRRPYRADENAGAQNYERGLYADIALNGICRTVGINPQGQAFTEAISDLLHERRMERCSPENQAKRGEGGWVTRVG
jgi:hypothetical protein